MSAEAMCYINRDFPSIHLESVGISLSGAMQKWLDLVDITESDTAKLVHDLTNLMSEICSKSFRSFNNVWSRDISYSDSSDIRMLWGQFTAGWKRLFKICDMVMPILLEEPYCLEDGIHAKHSVATTYLHYREEMAQITEMEHIFDNGF